MARRTSRSRSWGARLLVLVAAAIVPAAAVAGQPPTRTPCEPMRKAGSRVHQYRLAARIRPLLFWIGKDNVGDACLTWLKEADGEPGYGLLIGSDPARAPLEINRWGYVSERQIQGTVRVFETRDVAAGTGDRYRIVYGTRGELREVPVRIVYRPNWWFEAEAVLADQDR